jgi:hypothetical protein
VELEPNGVSNLVSGVRVMLRTAAGALRNRILPPDRTGAPVVGETVQGALSSRVASASLIGGSVWFVATTPHPTFVPGHLLIGLSEGLQVHSPVLPFLSLQLPLVLLFGGALPTRRTRQIRSIFLEASLSTVAFIVSKFDVLSRFGVPFAPSGRFVFFEMLGGLGLYWLARRRTSSGDRSPVRRNVLVLSVAAAGFGLRWQRLLEEISSPLAPDTETVSRLASRLGSMYEPSFREPLWVWLTRVSQWAFGVGPFASRVYSLAMSTLLLAAMYCFFRLYTGRWSLALLTTTALAAHPFLVESGSMGHRTELIIVTLFSFFFFLLVPNLGDRARTLGLAATAPLVCLTQMSALAVVGAGLAYGLLRGRLRPASVLATGLSTLLLLAPFLFQCSRMYQDPLHCLNIHAIFYRNHEFVRVLKVGCLGCPDPASLKADSYAGEPVTMSRYIFGMHSAKEVVWRITLGYMQAFGGKTFLRTLLGIDPRPGRILYFLGFLLLLFLPWRELLLIPLAAVNLFAFVVPMGVDVRLLAPSLPVLVFLLTLPLWAGVRSLVRVDQEDEW